VIQVCYEWEALMSGTLPTTLMFMNVVACVVYSPTTLSESLHGSAQPQWWLNAQRRAMLLQFMRTCNGNN
jgi:hypothetical protein